MTFSDMSTNTYRMNIGNNITRALNVNDSIVNTAKADKSKTAYDKYKISASDFNDINSMANVIDEMAKTLAGFASNEPVSNKSNSASSKNDGNVMNLSVQYIDVQDDGTTVVRWGDGKVTFVRCSKDDKKDLYSAFCAALAKRVYGSTSQVRKVVRDYNVDNINKKAEEEKRKANAERMKREKINHDRKIRSMAKQMRLEEEARSYCMSRK